MRRLTTLLAVFALLAPLAFYGCSGDDGAAGPAGPAGPPGAGGGPGTGVVALETCVACHAAGQPFDVNNMHRLNTTTGNPIPPGSVSVTVSNVAFGAPAGDNVPVTVDFTFAATDAAGIDITGNIDLRTATSSGLSYLRLTLAKLVAGTNGDADEWNGVVHRPAASGSGPFYENNPAGLTLVGTLAAGNYTYTFPDNSVRVSDIGSLDNAVVRTIVEVRGIPITNFTTDPYYNVSARRPAVDSIFDSVAPIGGGDGVAPTAEYPLKNTVSTTACNTCHDPLAIHGGSRREYKYCQACHNAKLETAAGGGWDNGNLVNLIHKIHNHEAAGVQNLGELGDFSEVTYPQGIRNCTKCHQGPDTDNTYSNWTDRPTITACGSCHITINFATGAGHIGGAQANNATCSLCHPASLIPGYHATENATPNNLQLPGTLVSFTYGIDEVTVDASNVATIKFWIQQDGAFVNLGDNVITRPAGFTGGPSFLFAYTLPQDGVDAPVDYNNLGRTNGQPESLSIIGLPIVAFDNTFAQYTVQRADAFPVGATMRAVALQGYFTQTNGADTNGDGALDNVGRHTFSVAKSVTGDTVRRVAVESGYTNNNDPLTGQPVGCLECHEIFEGHGGNRVSNAQVCVMCHNPNMTTSARTFATTPVNPDISALFGTDPLQYPEVSNNFKELIHGLHGAAKRTTNFVDIRNFRDGVLLQGDEITYPGDLSHCGKCHLNNLYQNVQTTGRLLTTAQITTGADNTVADVNAARATVPNATDLVNTPATSACGHCHDSDVARSHFVSMGGEIRAPRGTATAVPPPLGPVFP